GSRVRSSQVVFLRSQRSAAPARATSASTDSAVTQAMSHQEPPLGIASRTPTPRGSRTNTNGTMNAGRVYFQDWRVVLYGFPPVIAAAANGDSAVGGETSDRTA